MATKRITDLTAVTLLSGSAVLPIVQDGVTAQITFADLTGSIAGLGGTAVTASYALTAETASYAVSASYEISYETSSSYAETADVAISASYAQTATTAAGVYKDSGPVVIGNAIGDISVDGLDTTVVNITALGSAVVTGSLDVNGRAKFNLGASGSFSGSFVGDGSGLTGIVATLPSGVVSGSAQIDGTQIANNVINLGNSTITLGAVSAVPRWLNAVNLSDTVLDNAIGSGSFSGSFVGDGSGLTGVVATFAQQTLSADDTTIASATILTAGSVNIVDTADVSNTAVRLDSPLFGSVTHVVNTSDRTINVFPYDTGSAIFGQPSGSSVGVPNDGLMYTFTCIQNPGVGTWSFSTPTSQGGTSTQTRITLEETFVFTTESGSATPPVQLSSGSWGANSVYVTAGPNAQCAVLAPATSRVFWHPDFNNYTQISVVAVEVLTNIPTGDVTNAAGNSPADELALLSTGLTHAMPLIGSGVTLAQAYKDTYAGAPACSTGGLGYVFTSFDPDFNVNYLTGGLNSALAPHISLPGDPGTTGQIYQKYVRTFSSTANRQDLFDSLGYPRIYWHAAAAVGSNSTYRYQWLLGDGLELEFKIRVTFELYK